MMDGLSTDEILDIATHIDKNTESTAEFMASKGLDFNVCKRVVDCIVPEGDQRKLAWQSGFILGLQLGAMRLDPIEFVPVAEGDKTEQPCHCLVCELHRMAEGAEGDPPF
jgi:hypothetical protein